MAASRSDRNRSDIDAIAEKVFWAEINALKTQLRALSPGSVAAPVIIGQPQGQTAFVDGVAVFAVAVIATIPVQYQWRKGGVDIAGEVSATLVLRELELADAGDYSVVVSSGIGSVESVAATLTVLDTPQGIPVGGIIAWSGSLASIPANYHLCDGTGGTPNMLDRFIMGVRTAATNPGATGGNKRHTHSIATADVVGNETSSVSGGAPTIDAHTTRADVPAGGANTVLTGPVNHTLGAPAAHKHDLIGKTSTDRKSDGSAFADDYDALPPFYEAAWIMRMS